MGRVDAMCEQTIMITTMIGTARNMPTMPQMAPQSASDNNMKTGLTLSPVPMILGSTTLPPVN